MATHSLRFFYRFAAQGFNYLQRTQGGFAFGGFFRFAPSPRQFLAVVRYDAFKPPVMVRAAPVDMHLVLGGPRADP